MFIISTCWNYEGCNSGSSGACEWKPGATKRLRDGQWGWMADNSGPDKGELSSATWVEFQGFVMVQSFSLLLYTNIHIGAITEDGSSTGDNTG